jgi:ATP-dependent RNA helicase DOB1
MNLLVSFHFHVLSLTFRPVPLQHFLFPSGADGLYLVVDEKGAFREENFQKAMGFLQKEDLEDATSSKRPKKVRSKGQNTDLFRIVKLIMERELDPCIGNMS